MFFFYPSLLNYKKSPRIPDLFINEERGRIQGIVPRLSLRNSGQIPPTSLPLNSSWRISWEFQCENELFTDYFFESVEWINIRSTFKWMTSPNTSKISGPDDFLSTHSPLKIDWLKIGQSIFWMNYNSGKSDRRFF